MSRLSEYDLTNAERHGRYDLTMSDGWLRSAVADMAAEIRAYRLSPDDIEALRFARLCTEEHGARDEHRRAMSVLDRIIAANTDRGGAE